MYESYFGLKQRPFSSTPNPSLFVPLKGFQQTLDDLVSCIESGQGIGILTAPAGMGKTLVCQKLAEAIHDKFVVALLCHANFPTRRSFLQAVLYELGCSYVRMADQELRLELTEAVKAARSKNKHVALIVDEAHLLSERLLEEIRTLTNLVDQGTPLVRVVLSGQLPLEEKLTNANLSAFNQRIQCQLTLDRLSRAESTEYLAQRLRWTGGTLDKTFTPEAVDVICHASDGLPRCLNQLADHCLLLAYVVEQKPVGVQIVHEALEDLKQLPLHWNQPSQIASPAEQVRSEIRSGSPSVEHETAEAAGEIMLQDEECLEIGAAPDDPDLSRDMDTCKLEIGSSLEVDSLADDAEKNSDQSEADTETISSTAAYEVGSSLGFETSPAETVLKSVEATHPPKQVAVPSELSNSESLRPSRETTTPKMTEELVVDHYAALDARLAGIEDPPPVSTPEVHRTGSGAEKTVGQPRPDQIIDEIIPLLDVDSDLPDESVSVSPPMPIESKTDAARYTAAASRAQPELVSEKISADDSEAEAKIRVSLEDDGEDSEALIRAWTSWDEAAPTTETSPDDSDIPLMPFAESDEEYDVIQPDDEDFQAECATTVSRTSDAPKPADVKKVSASTSESEREPHFERLFTRLRLQERGPSPRRE